MDARYARQEVLPGFGVAGQRRLGDARVLVIGAGGLGSSVIPFLAGAGVGTIGIVDDDIVEVSNLHRQTIHSTADVGRGKVRSAADTVAALNPDTQVIAIEQRLTADNALEIFADYELVLDGSDNFPTRYLADDAAVLTGIAVVWGAVSQFGGQVGVSWAERGPTYRDLFPVPPAPGSVLSCEVGGVLPTVVGVIGSIMATEALKILSGVGTPLLGTVTTYDGLTGGFRELHFERDPAAAPVTELIDYEAFCGIVPALSPADLAARQDEYTLIDVRDHWETEVASLPGAVHIPMASLEAAIEGLDRSKPVVVFCHLGIRSASARSFLASNGFSATHLDGGIDAWSRDIDPSVARY
jgi:adenylyltransferase/sulfurtransferase